METLIVTLPEDVLHRLAAAHDEIAAKCRRRAAFLLACRENETRARLHLANLATLPDQVAERLRSGADLDTAAAAVASLCAVPVQTVRLYWRHWCRSHSAATVAARHALVYHLYSRGLSNVQIADKTGLHRVSVSRILRQRPGAITALGPC